MLRKFTASMGVVIGFLFLFHVTGTELKAEGKTLKKRVAVFTFKDKTDQAIRWWNGQSVGYGMTDMLITALVKSGKYRVIERTEIDKILQEQDLGSSGVVTPETAARIGKVLGVELAVIGAVTEFGHKRSGVGGRVSGIGIGVKSQSASVAVDVRLVDTSTGEILAAENVRKSKSKKGLKFRSEKLSFNSQNKFDQSLVGKATREAINAVARMIDKQAPKIKWQAKVVTARNGMVIINAGANAGVQVGQKFVVIRPGEELTDPDTGLSLGTMETKIGAIEVVNNQIGSGKASKCRIISGEKFQRGDVVREK